MTLGAFGELTNRELAIIFWIAVALVGAGLYSPTRRPLGNVLRVLSTRQIATPIALVLIYVAACVYLLSLANLWQAANLKTTLVWTITFAVMSLFQINSIIDDDNYFGKTVRESFKATGIIVFVTQTYTFSLAVELVLLPTLILIGAMIAISTRKPEYSQAHTFLNWLSAIAGIFILGQGIVGAASDTHHFLTAQTLMEFVTPILLTIMFLPAIYILRAYAAYQTASIRIDLRASQKSIRRYALRKAFLSFGGNVRSLNRWIRLVMHQGIATHLDVQDSIDALREVEDRAEHPHPVPWKDGWSPYAAKAFLQSEGYKTSDYLPSFSVWSADSTNLKVMDGLPGTFLQYGVRGSKTAVEQLELNMSADDRNNPDAADNRFFELAARLSGKALDPPGQEAVELLAGRTDNWDLAIQGRLLCLSTTRHGHSFWRTFTISLPSYCEDQSQAFGLSPPVR